MIDLQVHINQCNILIQNMLGVCVITGGAITFSRYGQMCIIRNDPDPGAIAHNM